MRPLIMWNINPIVLRLHRKYYVHTKACDLRYYECPYNLKLVLLHYSNGVKRPASQEIKDDGIAHPKTARRPSVEIIDDEGEREQDPEPEDIDSSESESEWDSESEFNLTVVVGQKQLPKLDVYYDVFALTLPRPTKEHYYVSCSFCKKPGPVIEATGWMRGHCQHLIHADCLSTQAKLLIREKLPVGYRFKSLVEAVTVPCLKCRQYTAKCAYIPIC